MAEADVQFGDGVRPVKTTQSRTFDVENDASLARQGANSDSEERALKITTDDLSRKHKQTYTGWILVWLAYQSTGVIYGDIGTSPLYVFSSTFTSQPSFADLVGALSIIIWSLTLIVSIKYVFIVLAADDDGEGGTFALYSLLARYANIVRKDPIQSGTVKMERYNTGDLESPNMGVRNFLETSIIARGLLKILGVVGVSMVIADGVLTPAQSVLGAIQGLRVVDASLGTNVIVGVSCAILVLLFLAQPLGVHRLAGGFAPIVIVWLLFNLCCGIYNLVRYDHTVLKAFSPQFAFDFFRRNKEEGWRMLGGLLLAFTGVEALFADLGAFSKRAVQLSWLFLAFPCLLMAYIGQAAYISQDATGLAFTNPFFNTVIPGTFYFGLVLAILAAVVASQALITASFQLLSQVMRLSYAPHIKTVHTSKKFHNQVYMPFANWLLMIGCVVVTAVYSNTTRLGNAYGVCVIVVTFISTILVTIVAIIIWRWNIIVVALFFLFFGTLDAVYMSSALTKVPHGAWFTILLSGMISIIFILWRYGKESQWKAEGEDKVTPSRLFANAISAANSTISKTENTQYVQDLKLSTNYGGSSISKIDGLGIFFDKTGHSLYLPLVFTHFLQKFHALPTTSIFFHMRPLSTPSIPEAERFVIQRVKDIPGCYRMTVRHGYTDSIISPDLAKMIVEQLTLFVTRDPSTIPSDNSSNSSAKSVHHSPTIIAELDSINNAANQQVVYIMGKELMVIKQGTALLRRFWLSAFLWIRENSRAKVGDWNIPVDRLIEVGFVKVI